MISIFKARKFTFLLNRKGLIYFPDFCDIVLERFRETEEEEEDLFGTLFKVCINCKKVCLYIIAITNRLFVAPNHIPLILRPRNTKFRITSYQRSLILIEYQSPVYHFTIKIQFTELMKNLPVVVEDEDIEEMFASADKDKESVSSKRRKYSLLHIFHKNG